MLQKRVEALTESNFLVEREVPGTDGTELYQVDLREQLLLIIKKFT